MELITHFADWCRLGETDITGYWDAGHRLQLVFGDAFRTTKFQKFHRLVYDVSSNYNNGKNSLIFKEAADDLFQATLTYKSKQDTRWVRAELRSLQAYLRNIPVFLHYIR